MHLIDSHCHLDFPEFDDDRSELIKNCFASNIQKFVVPGVSAATWLRLKRVADEFACIYPVYGLHPYFVHEHHIDDIAQLKLYIEREKPCAIGEIGLDFYRKDLVPEKQRIFLHEQLKLAEEFQLPVILHVRKAHDEMLQILRQYKIPGGICHAFNGSLQQAHQFELLGFKFGFGGAVTFENAHHLKKLVVQLNLRSIVLETDSPDMRPAELESTRNTPLTLLQVVSVIAELRRQSQVEIAHASSETVERLLRI